MSIDNPADMINNLTEYLYAVPKTCRFGPARGEEVRKRKNKSVHKPVYRIEREIEPKIKNRRFLKKYDGLKYGWLRDAKKFLVLLAILLIAFRLIIGFSFVKGDSMLPTLKESNLVLYTRINAEYRRGDVVSVRIPSGEYYVKRIIALGGDTVELKDGKVYVNGALLEEPYAAGETWEQTSGIVRYPYTVQDGQIFVMGDNRSVSMDSRNFGAVGERQIKGKIQFCVGKKFIRKM